VLLKGGAEGFVVGFVPDQGLGIAVKLADGASRAKMGVFAALLGRLGLLDAATTAALVQAVEGEIADSNGKPVGRIAVTLPA
jgi:L-asparaginase II